MKLRKGDLVQARNEDGRFGTCGMVDGLPGDFWCPKGSVGIKPKGSAAGHVESEDGIIFIKKREDVKDWWKYL